MNRSRNTPRRHREFPGRESHPALAVRPASAAWWYEEENGISVYCSQVNGPTFSCNISMRALKGFIQRADRARKGKRP
jgi:hypothetical protein